MRVIAPEIVRQKPSIDHLSWSGIQTYKQCPRRFRYRYIAKAAEEQTASALIYGGAIHRAIEGIYEARITGNAIPKQAILLERYEEAWTEAIAQKPAVTFAKSEDAATLKDQAKRSLEAYREYVVDTASRKTEVLAIEHQARFPIIKDGDAPPIEARLDLIERTGDELVISDLKTSRGSWNDEKAQSNLGQVVLYAHAIMPMVREFNAKRVVTKFIVLPKLKNAKVQVLTPRPEQSDVIRLKESVADVWQGVKSGVFPRTESWACKTCPFRIRCLGK